MADIDLRVSFNRAQRISFTRGEDRQLSLLLADENEGLPVDLTGAKLTFSCPRDGGGTIRRRTGGLLFSFAKAPTLNGITTIACPNHGLVNGDVISLETVDGNVLPTPYNPDSRYIVVTEENDNFGLLTLSGDKVALFAPSDASAMAVSDDFTLGNLATGQADLRFSSVFTQAAATGQGLSYQLTLRDAAGLTRILVASHQLDVFAQIAP